MSSRAPKPLYQSGQQTIHWFHQQYKAGTLTLRPPFQRKPVWMARNKNALIETVLLGMPIPEVYVQILPEPNGDLRYAVVDGQQRIRSLLQFIGSETDADETKWNKFCLDKLASDAEYFGMDFADLGSDDKECFWAYQLSVRTLNTEDEPTVRAMFTRLNRFSMPLKPQELRNAMYLGPFVKLSEALADEAYWAANAIVSAAAIRRMADVELVSDLLIGLFYGPQGGGPKIIDQYYATYEDYEDEFPDQRVVKDLFARVLKTIQLVLPEIVDTRWRNKNDFYSLFVALGEKLSGNDLKIDSVAAARKALGQLAAEVEKRRVNETATVPKRAIRYFDNVEKGANDKSRRAERHEVLLELLDDEWFAKKKKAAR